ncbi:putative aga operon transcriptional repressor [Petrimonas mucosa]|uniref:Putative aga operon transcriptional repressor n=2 Tax=Petrimonas mucosa TaxID=1642646 RepID=A0A1G4G6F7_9BACT|nr:putative aga operon transcriptional repressor [Petrimonas mucosa]
MYNNSMNYELRKKIIIDLLNEKEIITISEISKRCNVSKITVRRDFLFLEQEGKLKRTHGGAVIAKNGQNLFTFNVKVNQNIIKKEEICRIAANHIQENDIIFIDCGTTLFHMINYIKKFKSLIVITTSLPIISELLDFPNIKLIIIGGEVEHSRKAIYGPVANKNINLYHADKAFIGADGVSLKNGLSSYDEMEASITLKMAENSSEVFLLCDSSKIEKNSFYRFADFSKIDHLITNRDISDHHLREYRDMGIDVIIE